MAIKIKKPNPKKLRRQMKLKKPVRIKKPKKLMRIKKPKKKKNKVNHLPIR